MSEDHSSGDEMTAVEEERNAASFAKGLSSAAEAAASRLKVKASRVYISVVEDKLLRGVDMKDRKNKGGVACSICCAVCGSLSILLSACTYFIISAIFVWAILDNAVITSEHCIGYDFWLTNIGGVSPPEYECFHMFNLTNLETVQAGGMAVYDEVGPYCYVIQKEKFNVEWEDDEHTVSHQTWQYYVYSPKMSVGDPDEDIIVNLSPGYLGIVMVLHGEELLPIVMTGTIIGTNIEWLTSVFVHHMQSNTTASLLPLQQETILSGGTSLDDFYATWANETAAPSEEWEGMLVSFQGQQSGIPLAAAQLLWDDSVPYSLTNLTKESVAGWFNASVSALPDGDFTDGDYIDATTDSWSFLASEFGITVEQVQMIGTWLRESFFVTYTNPSLVTKFSALDNGVKEVRDIGWLQWAACNVVNQDIKVSANKAFYFYPGGKPEYGCSDPLAPPLSVDQSKQLLMGDAGVVSLPGLVEFVVVYADASVSCPEGSLTANLTACSDCSTCASLSCISTYVGNSTTHYSDPVYGTCGFNATTKACESYSSDFLCSLSMASLSCSGTVDCEHCALGKSTGNGSNSSDAMYCSGCSCSDYPTQEYGFPACVECNSCANHTSCNDTAIWTDFYDEWGLTKTEADYFFAYLGIMVLDYGDQELDRVLNANGGLFKTMSVNDWLYHPEDPLMRIVEPYFPIDGRLVVNTTSKQEAEENIPPSTLYTGKGNLDNLNRYIKYRNQTEITYAVEIPVAGQDEWGQFQPFQKERGIDHLYMFDPNYVRELEIVKMMEVEYRGVELWRYSFSNSTWAPNPDYFMTIPGFTNQTIIEGSPIFLSIAHWQGVPDEYTSKVKGVVENRNWRTDYSVIDIEPHTGLVFHTNASLMVSLYLEPHMSDWLSVYNPNVTVDTFYPVMWALEQALFSKENALEYNLLVGFMLWLQKITVGFYLAAGLVMLVCSFMLWKWVRDIRPKAWDRFDYEVVQNTNDTDEETENLLSSLES